MKASTKQQTVSFAPIITSASRQYASQSRKGSALVARRAVIDSGIETVKSGLITIVAEAFIAAALLSNRKGVKFSSKDFGLSLTESLRIAVRGNYSAKVLTAYDATTKRQREAAAKLEVGNKGGFVSADVADLHRSVSDITVNASRGKSLFGKVNTENPHGAWLLALAGAVGFNAARTASTKPSTKNGNAAAPTTVAKAARKAPTVNSFVAELSAQFKVLKKLGLGDRARKAAITALMK